MRGGEDNISELNLNVVKGASCWAVCGGPQVEISCEAVKEMLAAVLLLVLVMFCDLVFAMKTSVSGQSEGRAQNKI